MNFGLMFFAASEDSLGAAKYRLIVESARFADRAGFSTIWVPERHFTGFGGLYPNPAVLHAALAMCTSTIRLNAGSVVAPLHHPARIAEEWSVVDNLSNGRVGLSFASGWNPNDFVLFPERYATRDDHLLESMQAVQALWRGEPFAGTDGRGRPCQVTTFPRPVQPELPVWMTVAGNPRNFERAGRSGANLLTHLLDQDEAVLASRITLYRQARAAAGFDPATGQVSLMIHTLVGGEAVVVREQARRPYCEYIKANIGLFGGLAQSRGRDADLSAMTATDLDEFANFLYDRFAAERGLIGTPESCAALVSRLEHAGVTELACLLDFGPDVELILSNLPHLARLKDLDRTGQSSRLRTPAPLFDPAHIRLRCDRELSGDEFHARLARHGIRVEGLFQPPTTIWRRDGEALGRLTLGAAAPGYHVHPASLDACCRILAAALPAFDGDAESTCLPAGFRSCDLRAPLSGTVWIHARLAATPDQQPAAFSGDVHVYDEGGGLIAAIAGIRLVPFEPRSAPIDTSHLRYERVWHATPETAAENPPTGTWAVIADDVALARELSVHLSAHGAQVVTKPDQPGLRGIIYLCARGLSVEADADAVALARAVEHTVHGALTVLQASGPAPVWIVTRGAVPELPPGGSTGGARHNLAQAPLWGLGRALAVERPGALGGLVDIDPAIGPAEAAQRLLDVIGGSRREDMVAFQGGERFVPRLRRVIPASRGTAPVAFDANETVLITGGVGGLGSRLIGWLVSRGARHFVLCSRGAPSASALAELERLGSSGIDLLALAVDVADDADLSRQLGTAAEGRPAVTSVFHLAGTLDDGRMEAQTWARFAGVFRAKVQGAWNLHRLTRAMPLRHFVMFSSVAALLPAPGQSSYAAANAFLDALAAYRRARDLPALTVNWGPWAEVGHAATDYGRRAHAGLASLGIGAIAPGDGLHALDMLLQEERTHGVVVAVDWPRLFRADPGARRLGLLADLAAADGGASPDRARQPSALLDALRALPAVERRAFVLQFLSDLVTTALKLCSDEPLDPRQRLFEIGVDSILALELKDRLERAVGVRLSATLLFVHPTLESLAGYILTEIVGEPEPAPAVAPASESVLSEAALTHLLLQEIDVSRGA